MASHTRCLFLVMILIAAPCVGAAEPHAQESGFSGRLSLGAVFADASTNMVASPGLGLRLGAASIRSIDGEPRAREGLLPAIDLRLRYTFASTGTQLFLETGHGDSLQFDGFAQGGLRQRIGHAGEMSLAYLYGSPMTVWADPYVAGVKRAETTRQTQGAQVGWEGILGSPLQLRYTFQDIAINHERSGTFLGLGLAESKLLRRAGSMHQGEIRYPFSIAAAQQLTPGFSYTRQELRGKAMSDQTFDFKLAYALHSGPVVAQLEGSIGRSVHDDRNPVFGRTQADTRYGASATVLYRTPFGWAPLGHRRWSLFATVAYNVADSNIDFYSASVFATGLGLSMEF